MTLADSEYEKLRRDFARARNYSEKVALFIKYGISNLTIYKNTATGKYGRITEPFAMWLEETNSMSLEDIAEVKNSSIRTYEGRPNRRDIQITSIEPETTDEFEILFATSYKALSEGGEALFYNSLIQTYNSSTKASPLLEQAIRLELKDIEDIKLNYTDGSNNRVKLTHVKDSRFNQLTPAPDYPNQLFVDGYETKLRNKTPNYAKLFELLYSEDYTNTEAFYFPVNILKHYFIGESILQYEVFLLNEIESLNTLNSTSMEEPSEKIKLSWNADNDVLYDLFAQLTVLTNKEGNVLIPNTLKEIANLLSQSFEGLPAPSTIESSLSKFRGKNPNRPKRFKLDVNKSR